MDERIIGIALISLFLGVGCAGDDVSGPETEDRARALLAQKDHVPEGFVLKGPFNFENSRSSGALRTAVEPPSWEDDKGEALDQSDDDCDKRAFGFTFFFFGQPFTEVWINSNGNLTFNACNLDYWHPDIPDKVFDDIIGPLYGDFDPGEAGDVFFNVLGTPPNRRVVITWMNVPEFDPDDGSNSFQVILFEGSNDIQFGYNGLTTDGVNWTFDDPSTEPDMEVGIATNPFIRSAKGSEIPPLDGTNICYRSAEDGEEEDDELTCPVAIELMRDALEAAEGTASPLLLALANALVDRLEAGDELTGRALRTAADFLFGNGLVTEAEFDAINAAIDVCVGEDTAPFFDERSALAGADVPSSGYVEEPNACETDGVIM